MLVSKKKYDALVADNAALQDRIDWMEAVISEYERVSASKRLLNKLDRMKEQYDRELKRAPRHQAIEDEVDLNAWAREMKQAHPDNSFSWTD